MIFAPMVVNFGNLKINVFDHGSVIAMGPNQFIDQFVSYKRNQGYGEQNGDFVPMIIPISYIYDSDIGDSWTAKNSII
ncbi:hypothetical protein ACIQXV_08780 [Neobacillus sp. NPDC097160]|uniref:hypothetical protein n=1 Tax=Neobacillus sp. NPDC097160 TaxID=3364298 RepID=UPI0038102ACB